MELAWWCSRNMMILVMKKMWLDSKVDLANPSHYNLNKMACLPVCIANSSFSVVDMVFWSSSCKNLLDGFKLVWLYPYCCRSPRPNSWFIFTFWTQGGHFPNGYWQVKLHSPLWHSTHMCTCFVTSWCRVSLKAEKAFLCVLLPQELQFHPHHCSKWALTKIVPKIAKNFGFFL